MYFLTDNLNPQPLWLWILVTFLGGALVIAVIFIILSKKYKSKK